MLTVLHATDKAGKTLLAWELARSVVSGMAFLPHGTFAGFPVRRGRVLMALLDDAAQINAFRRDLFGLAEFDDDVWLMTEYPERRGMPVAPEKVIGLLREACEAFEPALVILDALYRFIPTSRDAGRDDARMAPLMHTIDALTKRGAGVALIAHDRKDEDDVAGSYVIRAAAKQRLHLQKYPLRQPPRDGEPRDMDTGKRILRVTGKLGAEAMYALMLRDPGRFAYVSDNLDAARAEWKRERQESTEAVVVAWFAASNQGTVETVTRAVGRRREDVFSAIRALVEIGQLETFKLPSSGGRPATGYRICAANRLKKEPDEGTKVSDPRNPCETGPNGKPLSFLPIESMRNESPTAETLVPSPGTKVSAFVPSYSSFLEPPPFVDDARELPEDVADDSEPPVCAAARWSGTSKTKT